MTRILREGFALPFTKEPEPASFNNNRSVLNNRESVTREILDLLSSGRIREVNISEVHTVNPLTVANNGEKLRLIIDRRHINQYLQVPKFKCDDIRLVNELFDKGDFFFKFDIRSGYHRIDIHPAYQKFFAFAWSISGQVRYFVFTVLVFGLSSAPFVFTKVLKVLIKHWHSFGIRIIAFIDDGFVWGFPGRGYKVLKCCPVTSSQSVSWHILPNPNGSQNKRQST